MTDEDNYLDYTYEDLHNIRMPNRTIYLPDELDQASRRLGLNLSRITQEAISAYVEQNGDDAVEARVAEFSNRASAMPVDWPKDPITAGRRESGER